MSCLSQKSQSWIGRSSDSNGFMLCGKPSSVLVWLSQDGLQTSGMRTHSVRAQDVLWSLFSASWALSNIYFVGFLISALSSTLDCVINHDSSVLVLQILSVLVPIQHIACSECRQCENLFLDALASLDFKLSVSEWVIHLSTASASTGLSDFYRTQVRS